MENLDEVCGNCYRRKFDHTGKFYDTCPSLPSRFKTVDKAEHFMEPVEVKNPGDVKPDMINRPPHYTMHSIEPITVIKDWKMGFMDGQVLKYISRWRYKNGLEDLKKAQYYLNALIEEESKETP